MTTRRSLLAIAGLAVPALAATAAHAQTATVSTAPALSKAQVGYQDVPGQGKVCAQCVYFIFYPANGPAPASRCKLVAGPISPAGWCEIWQPGA